MSLGKQSKRVCASFESLEGRRLFASAIGDVLKDINPGLASSIGTPGPGSSVELGGLTYFTADDGQHGAELWRTNGTAAGTQLVADLLPRPESSRPRSLIVHEGKLAFVADWANPNNYPQKKTKIWISDGTVEGTTALVDQSNSWTPESPYDDITETAGEPALVPFDGKLLFLAAAPHDPYDSNVGRTYLWQTDGTSETTQRYYNYSAAAGSTMSMLTVAGDRAYVRVHNDNGTYTLARYDLSDIFQTPQTYNTLPIHEMVAADDKLYLRTSSELPYQSELFSIDEYGFFAPAAASNFKAYDLVVVNDQLLISGAIDYGSVEAFRGLYHPSSDYGVDLIDGQSWPDNPLENLTAVGDMLYYSQTRDGPGEYVTRYDTITGQFTPLSWTNPIPWYPPAFDNITDATPGAATFVKGPDGYVYFQAKTNGNFGLFRANNGTQNIETIQDTPYGSVGNVLPPASFMTVGGEWYAPGLTWQYGREWHLAAYSQASISGRVIQSMDGTLDHTYESDLAAAGVIVYLDENFNSKRDADEPTVSPSRTGYYAFQRLASKRYMVRLDGPADTKIFTPQSGSYDLSLQENEGRSRNDFIIQTPKQTHVTLYNDTDGDGAFDAGEGVIAGRTLFVDTDRDGVLDTGESSAVTNTSGVATFTLYDGYHSLRQVLPSGWEQTTSTILMTQAGGYSPVPTYIGTRFNPVLDATVTGGVFSDPTNNGTLDGGGVNLAGRTIFIDADNDGVFDSGERSTTSNVNGRYSLNGFAAGAYVIRQVLPAGWEQTTPRSGSHSITVAGHTSFGGRDFGSRLIPVAPPTIIDLARGKPAAASTSNSTTRTADKAVDGNTTTRWASSIADNQWIRVDLGQTSTITSVNLKWEYAYAKGYKIQVSNDGNTWTDIYSTATGDGKIDTITGLNGVGRYVRLLDVTRGTPYGISLFDFNVYGYAGAAGPVNPSSELTGSISGVVFNDFNRNGVRDPDDSGRAGWVVYHDRDNDGVLDGGETTAVTNGAGLFTFASLPPGAYNLKLSVPSGSEWTTPVPPAVTVTAGGSVTGLLFGAYTPPVTPPANQIIDLARTAIITASSQENSTNTAAKAADGISSTRWASAYTDNQWITVDLRAPYTVVTGVRLNWEAAFGRSYKVQTSQDGLVWTDRIVVTSSDGGVDEHTFSSSVSARYVRMLGVSRATRYGYSLYDFNVYGPAGTGNPVPPQDLITGSISGYTFNDSDKDGVLDTGESKAGGKTVFLDANNNSRLDSGERSVVTASDGSYTFTALAAGTHRVRRVFPTGYTYSTPLIDLTLSAGQKVTNAVIGSRTI